MKPRVCLLLGDATGIGPELVAKLLAAYPVHEQADLVVAGDRRVFEMGQQIAKTSVPTNVIDSLGAATFGTADVQFLDFPGVNPGEFELGKLSAKVGKSVLDVLAFTLDAAKAGRLDAIVFGPFNKQAMHLGGSPFPDELHFMADRLGWTGYCSERSEEHTSELQ